MANETDAERAHEIASEFYPRATIEEPAGSSQERTEENEQLSRICDLARQLGYNDARTKMLVSQWRQSLTGLERKLRNQLEEGSQGAEWTGRRPVPVRAPKGHRHSSTRRPVAIPLDGSECTNDEG